MQESNAYDFPYACTRCENHPDIVLPLYEELLSQGEAEGFFPVVLLDPEETEAAYARVLYEHGGIAAFADGILKSAARLPIEKIWDDLVPEAAFSRWPKREEARGDFYWEDPLLRIEGHDAQIIKLPAAHPWEVFAYLPFGGFNTCPSNDVWLCIAKYWYFKYSAIPCYVGASDLAFAVPEPVHDARSLAVEQLSLASDMQQITDAEELCRTLETDPLWYLYWAI